MVSHLSGGDTDHAAKGIRPTTNAGLRRALPGEGPHDPAAHPCDVHLTHAAYPSKGITMSSPNRRSFLARSAALAAVPTVAMLAWRTLTGQASAATLADSAPVPQSELPLTDRHLTRREQENLALVLRAYHDREGDSLDPQGFRDLVAADGVLNGIGGV